MAALWNANLATYLFVLCIAGITSVRMTVCAHEEHEAYSFPDVAHMRQFDAAIRSNTLEWYDEGMQLFSYSFNRFEWGSTYLTWALTRESSSVPREVLLRKIRAAFGQWSAHVPQFVFAEVHHYQQPQIKFSFETFSDPRVLSDISFPTRNEGLTIHINNGKNWTNQTDRGWYNLDAVILYEICRSLGLGKSNHPTSVMNPKYMRFDRPWAYEIGSDDVTGIRDLYRIPPPRR